jgi:hypothetical protein
MSRARLRIDDHPFDKDRELVSSRSHQPQVPHGIGLSKYPIFGKRFRKRFPKIGDVN